MCAYDWQCFDSIPANVAEKQHKDGKDGKALNPRCL
jgi:hypothetical protein